MDRKNNRGQSPLLLPTNYSRETDPESRHANWNKTLLTLHLYLVTVFLFTRLFLLS